MVGRQFPGAEGVKLPPCLQNDGRLGYERMIYWWYIKRLRYYRSIWYINILYIWIMYTQFVYTYYVYIHQYIHILNRRILFFLSEFINKTSSTTTWHPASIHCIASPHCQNCGDSRWCDVCLQGGWGGGGSRAGGCFFFFFQQKIDVKLRKKHVVLRCCGEVSLEFVANYACWLLYVFFEWRFWLSLIFFCASKSSESLVNDLFLNQGRLVFILASPRIQFLHLWREGTFRCMIFKLTNIVNPQA